MTEPIFSRQITTIERFILDQQQSYPAATGVAYACPL